jgi:hypothetical protein
VYALANHYHFTEYAILWEIPYQRALRYIHAALFANGAWTVKLQAAPKAEFSKILKVAEEVYTDGWDDC